jgi:DNA-binding GntR family transcriptional regulator
MLDHGPSRAEKRFKSLTKVVFEEIREAILAGKLAPGERLFEAKLAASLKVGPVAVRESLRSLETKGYVTFRPDNEVIVSKPSHQEIEDAYTIAGVIEGLAARLAAERATADEIAHLRELHKVLKESCQKRDVAHYFDANNRFHRFIAEIARNERLYVLIDQLRQDIQKTRVLALRSPQRLEYSMREHDQILDAFLKKNPALAESTAVRHLKNQMLALEQALDALKGEKS